MSLRRGSAIALNASEVVAARGMNAFLFRYGNMSSLIVACAAGELVGIGVATGAALAINALIGEPQSLGSRFLTLATFAASVRWKGPPWRDSSGACSAQDFPACERGNEWA